ncbi:recombination and DNA strand exchange inhibitor protein [Gloeobacter kilaueensis JS1]|uniref:Recombination and DNA strand exchange inhibitor protein n=2 Tax=Gloeobacter TaxID=33071 RepID=U5QC98_GLOK1|nr:Uma2 family endonuclease [Gloeobacter kilaueensis]AGY56448.1 recombination and DNA strand exchange inhibitor protein [Gloeobacter kilaueensis JS1]
MLLNDSITYPESDGRPMADNTEQFRWIVYLKENLEWLFAADPAVFVAGDLLWYPIEGKDKLCQAPDVLVAFGRAKGRRGSYRQWLEGNIPPQVVIEVISPGNTIPEMTRKFQFYERYGVEEYYLYDPDRGSLDGFIRQDEGLVPLETVEGWVSPRLGIHFLLTGGGELQILRPDGQPFESFQVLAERAEQERQRAEQERQRAEQERQRAEQERQRAERLAERLRQLGIDPDSPGE